MRNYLFGGDLYSVVHRVGGRMAVGDQRDIVTVHGGGLCCGADAVVALSSGYQKVANVEAMQDLL